MKKLFLILLIALSTCTAIEENFDDDVVLEKSKGKALPIVKRTTKVTTRRNQKSHHQQQNVQQKDHKLQK